MVNEMEKYKRIFVIVLDSLGIGAMPDSEKFGDTGVDTSDIFWIVWELWIFPICRKWEWINFIREERWRQ